MKNNLLFCTGMALLSVVFAATPVFCQSVTISPNSSAGVLELSSTTNGFLLPRMTISQRNGLSATAGLQVFCTNCTPAGPYTYNGSSWLAMIGGGGAAITYIVGQLAQGGVIFWVDATGQHGLVAATNDLSSSVAWYNGSYVEAGAERISIYGGKDNTDYIVKQQGDGTYAALLATQHNGGSFGDWYLPAKDELDLMYQLRTTIGSFGSGLYWSSTEVPTSPATIDAISDQAYAQNFSTGAQSARLKSNLGVSIRAIRRF
jgi:hypothetical protein